MILGNTSGTGENIGFNSDMTLGVIARELAQSRPQAFALVDSSDRPIFTDGARRKLTWKGFDEEVARLARRILALQLGRDAVIAYQMPNTVEAFVVFMAILRAGCIAAPLPLAWRKHELTPTLSQLSPRAVITTGRAGPVNHAEILRQVSADVFSVRFVLAYGRNLPDGVIPLDEDICPIDEEPEEEVHRSGAACDHVAVITWDALPDGLFPVARSHAALIAMGLAHVLETGIGGGDTLATTLLNSSAAGLGLGFVTALLAGAPLILHQPFSSRVFAGALITENVTHAVLPGNTLAAMLDATRLPNRPLRSVTAFWRPQDTDRALHGTGDLQVTDAMAFGEMGYIIQKRRDASQPAPLKTGAIKAGEGGPVLINTRVSTRHTLELNGAMVPENTLPVPSSNLKLPVDDTGWLDTGFAVETTHGTFTPTGSRDGVVQIGGLAFPQDLLEKTLKDSLGEKDAARLGCQSDILFGQRVETTDDIPVERMKLHLNQAGVSPALAPHPRKQV